MSLTDQLSLTDQPRNSRRKALSLELFLAGRYLRSKRKEVFISIITVISVLGVAISVMVLDIALAIMTGLETELKAKLIDAGAHIVVRRFGGDIEQPQRLIDSILKVPNVQTVTPFSYNQALISSPAGSRGLLVRGIPDDLAVRTKLTKMSLSETELDNLYNPPKVTIERPDGELDDIALPSLVIGKALQDQLRIYPGMPVTLFSPQMGNSPQGLIPKTRRFVVAGTYKSGLQEYEAGLAYASLTEAQRFFGLDNRVSGLEIMLTDMFKAQELKSTVLDFLVRDLGEEGNQYFAADWTEPNKPLWDAMKLEKQVYFIVLLLLIAIASFSIVSTLVMVVIEKSRDIAVLKSIGAPDAMILRVFLFQGAIIGAAGVILGTLLGYLGCLGLREYGFPLDEKVFSLTEVPVRMVPENFVIVALAALVITLFAGVYPSRRASKLRPADALRFE